MRQFVVIRRMPDEDFLESSRLQRDCEHPDHIVDWTKSLEDAIKLHDKESALTLIRILDLGLGEVEVETYRQTYEKVVD